MRYNLHTICRAANMLAHSMARSQAFKTAWGMAKGQAVEKVTGVQFNHRQAAIAHLMQYPEDAIRFHPVRERDNRYDVNAVAVAAEVIGRGQIQNGVPAYRFCRPAGPDYGQGQTLRAALKSIVGGAGEGLSYGLRVRVAI